MEKKVAKSATAPAVIDHRTEAGRAQIDKTVKSLLRVTPQKVGSLADAARLDTKIVSASVKRLVGAGLASSEGERGQTTYRKAPKA